MARKSMMEQLSIVADPWNLELKPAKPTGIPLDKIYPLYFYPFRLKAFLGKNARFPD